MKKTLSMLLLTACCSLNAPAQLASGYYRIQNAYTDRYISIEDNNIANYPISQSGTVTMSGIRTVKPGTKVSTSPSTITYVKNISGTQYDIEGQGTSIHDISGNRLFINLLLQPDGSYQAYGHYIIDIWLADDSDPDLEESYIKNKSEKTRNWWARPVDTDDQYLGILPDVEVDGKYYGTIYAAFPIRLVSSGMKAYCVTKAAEGSFSMQEINGDIPAMTPVVIECSSNSPANNKILPVSSEPVLGATNMLYGTLCARVSAKYYNVQPYDPTTMRTLGKSNGKLAFVKATSNDLVKDAYLKANKAYLLVPGGASDVLVLGNENTNPQPGDQFTTSGTTYTIGANNTVTLDKVEDGLEGAYKIPEQVQHNGQNYVVTAIAEHACENQSGMTDVSIPSTVTSIGEKAFAGCSSLVAIYTYATEPPVLGNSSATASVFESVSLENCAVYVPEGCVEKYKTAEGWKDFSYVSEIGTGIREITNTTTANDRWYSLDGREMKTQPSKKGIYIRNGKKVVIK